MAGNAFLTNDIICNAALDVLDNLLAYGDKVHRGYEAEFDNRTNGYNRGETVKVRKPALFTVTEGATMQIQDAQEGYQSVTVDRHINVAFQVSAVDRTLKITDFMDRVLLDPMVKIADFIDRAVAANYIYIPNSIGTPGNLINSFADFNLATTRMTELAVPEQRRMAILSPPDHGALAANFTGLFTQGINERALTKGELPMVDNVSVDRSANAPRHTVGVATGTPRVNGANQNVNYSTVKNQLYSNLITDGWTNATGGILKAGDIFTIADVYAINPVSGEVIPGVLRQFTVMEDVDSGASTGPATIKVIPAIIYNDGLANAPYATVSAVPADDALITVQGTGGTTYRQNIVFNKNFAHLTCVPLVQLEGIPGIVRKTYKGLSLVMTPVADGVNYINRYRLDCLFGTGPLDPARMGVRAYGTP